MKRIFLGRPFHWLLWLGILAGLYAMGSVRLQARDFNLFVLCVLAIAAVAVLAVVLGHRKGDRVTREPLEDE